MTSYQKIKAKNAKLQNKINELESMIADDNVLAMFGVKKKVQLRRNLDESIWMGDSTNLDKTFGGLIK